MFDLLNCMIEWILFVRLAPETGFPKYTIRLLKESQTCFWESWPPKKVWKGDVNGFWTIKRHSFVHIPWDTSCCQDAIVVIREGCLMFNWELLSLNVHSRNLTLIPKNCQVCRELPSPKFWYPCFSVAGWNPVFFFSGNSWDPTWKISFDSKIPESFF